MILMKDVIYCVLCMICMIFYAVGALSVIPFIVFFIVLFRFMQLICALLLAPFIYLIEKLSQGKFKRLKIRHAFTYTVERIYDDWLFIRRNFLDF